MTILHSIISTTERLLPKKVGFVLSQSMSREGFHRYLKNTGWMFSARLFLMAMNFFIAAYLARYLEPADFGVYNYVISFVGLFAFVAGLGIDAILGRELITHSDKKEKILGSAFYVYISSAILAFVVTNLVASVTTIARDTQILIGLFSLTFLFQVSGIFNIYFLSHVQAKQSAQIQIASGFISAILKIIGFLSHASILWFISIFIVEAAIYGAWSLSTFKKLGGHIDFSIDWILTKKLLMSSFPFMLTIVATSIYMKIDQIMISHMLDLRENGIYSVAVKLAEMWYFIPSIICTSLFPAIVNAKKVSVSLYHNRVKALVVFMLVLAVIFAIPLFFLSPYIISIVYGPLYLDAIAPFGIYVWSSIPVFIMPALAAYMTAEHMGGKLLFATVSGAITNIILNLILIPEYGIIGSAIATFISYAIPALYLYFDFEKRKN